jgi:Kdo2-lipid IVA lauroyltransferase/acyltransferase
MTGYYLLRLFSWLIYKMPRRVFHFHSDVYFVIVYYIVRYRRNVVDTNLANSFPEKTKKERNQIAKDFYYHLCDTFLETINFDRFSVSEGKNCAKYLNPELPNSYLDQGRDVIIFLGHYNNWEWFTNWSLYSEHRFHPIYKKLKNRAFERFYFNLRSRFGAVPLERADTFRQLITSHQKGIPSMSAFLFDQTPRSTELHHWITFLNQDTPVILGAEKMAQKLDAVVLFLYSKKVKRGYYEIDFRLVTDHAKACPKFEITDKCNHLLEQQIIENPAYWLWSHKRWKYKKEEVAGNKL